MVFYIGLKNKKSLNQLPNQFPYKSYCEFKEDCIPATYCHADSAVNKYYAPNCSGMLCTTECTGPLDCGAGYIDCIRNHCVIIPSKHLSS